MKHVTLTSVGLAFALASCGPDGPPAIQSVTVSENEVRAQYDPTQLTNSDVREFARTECKKLELELKDVTVAPTEASTTSIANIFCE